MQRIVFFTDSPSWVPTLHFRALLDAVAARDDFEIAAVVTARPDDVLRRSRLRHAREAARTRILGWLSPERRPRHPLPPRLDFEALARRHGFRVLVPEALDVNDPRFVERLAKEVRPTVAFSCFCFRRFGLPLLGAFEQAVNYHDGFLPGYRGSWATSWSIYRGERESGWSFHRMTEALDAGGVLLSGGVEIGDDDGLDGVGWRKTLDASRRVPELLDAVAEARPGEPQRGEVRLFRYRDVAPMRLVEHPGELDEAELRRRIRAFDVVFLKLDGTWWPATRLERVERVDRVAGPRSFTTRDGVALRATRLHDMPAAAWRLRTLLRGPASPA